MWMGRRKRKMRVRMKMRDEEMEEEEEEELDSVSNVKKEATKSKAMMAPSNFRAMAAKTATSNRH